MPTSNQIDTAIKNIPQFFVADKIINGECLKTKKGNPFCRPGGLCRVYKFQLEDASLKALRLWTDIISEAKERSIAISYFLQSHPSKYFVNFEYIDDALIIDGEKYPAVLMDWCEGINMKSYITKCIESGELDKIRELAHEFYLLTKELEGLGISHGDLHHDNILVQSDGSLKLIDYDSMFVPALSGYKDECMGYIGYQHPTARAANEFLQPYTDYFSELIIFLTIYIVADHPELWDVDKVEAAEKELLFKISELNPKTVNQYNDWNVKGLPLLIEWYKKFLSKKDLKELKPLSFIIELTNIYRTQIVPPTQQPKQTVNIDISSITSKW